MNPKQIAAEHAVTYIQDGMTVGLGTGTTATYAIAALAHRLAAESLTVRCVSTSDAIAALAAENGIPLADWSTVTRLDMTIDGADEVDPQFRLIKGGGGALVREKLAAAVTDAEIIIVDDSKLKENLGEFPLPVAVVPYGWQTTRERLLTKFDCPVALRIRSDGSTFVSDDGLYVFDLHFGAPLPDPDRLNVDLKTVIGVVEHGLFIGLCRRVVIGYPDGNIAERVAG